MIKASCDYSVSPTRDMIKERQQFKKLQCLVKYLSILLIIIFSFFGCSNKKQSVEVRLNENLLAKDSFLSVEKDKSLRFAISTMITPDETMSSYKNILDYVSDEIGQGYELVMRDSYGKVNDLIRDGEVDLAFICSGAYADISGFADVELVAAPVIKGEAHYHSYIIVHPDSGIETFDELKNKTFTFVDPLSNSGRYYPLFLLQERNTTPSEFFSNSTYTYSHTSSIEMVASRDVDGAAVDSLVYDYLIGKNPEMEKQLKIINISPTYATPPFVTSGKLNDKTIKLIQEALTNMHQSQKGKEILDELAIDKFADIDDEAYDSIKAMMNQIKEN